MNRGLVFVLLLLGGCATTPTPAPTPPAPEAEASTTFSSEQARCERISRCRAKPATAVRVEPPPVDQPCQGIVSPLPGPAALRKVEYGCACGCDTDADCGEDNACVDQPALGDIPPQRVCAAKRPPSGPPQPPCTAP